MDHEERVYALTDESIAREIERALRVRPGPTFLAAVRSRVAQEPARVWSIHRNDWRVLAAVGALLALSAATFQRAEPASGPASAPVPVLSPTYVSTMAVGLRDAVASETAVRSATTNRRERFDVLIAPKEAAALRRLLNDAPLNVTADVETTTASDAAAVTAHMPEIVIPFIAIDLLESTKTLEGGTP